MSRINIMGEDAVVESGSERTRRLVHQGLAGRRAAELRFRAYGVASISLGMLFLVILFSSIVGNGYTAFIQTELRLDVALDESLIIPDGKVSAEALAAADYSALLKQSLTELFPEVTDRQEKRSLYGFLSTSAAHLLQETVEHDPSLIGQRISIKVPVKDDVDLFFKGRVDTTAAEEDRKLNDNQIVWLDTLKKDGRLTAGFNRTFFSSGDSREPEQAGIWGAVVGSALVLVITLALSLPLGMATAIYLEEFAPKNRWTDLIEVNINNLAAVPSIVFGLLGLAVFINFFGVPRSSPLVGGVVLALMTLPVIIIAGRSALQSVPPSIREAAWGMGASGLQTVFHHVFPLAIPGMMTGAIIGMSRALGESAPLLMIGMVAFIVDIPKDFLDPSTVLPVQIYLWADSPERGFVERTSAAIMVLLAFLVLMNGTAVYLRRRFERRW
ncbi:phosphate ABC transporter permease PstA [Candidatus Methylospira mobilis]|nr:phosphate ABC transporter permease PstA [Candidatus Methylospira mobilis]WNV04726.1 phosphate ABC transporter permease PstA [Candidatus Methylospira mobilis]